MLKGFSRKSNKEVLGYRTKRFIPALKLTGRGFFTPFLQPAAFFANSSHPYDNPTPLSNFAEMFAILLVSAALLTCYGSMCGHLVLAQWLCGRSFLGYPAQPKYLLTEAGVGYRLSGC